MEAALLQNLLALTKQALDAGDWNAVERLWQPWIEQGDPEAAYQLAYHYLWGSPCDDDQTRDRMMDLARAAAAKDHPDASWFLAMRQRRSHGPDPDYDQQVLRAGRLGSMRAQRELGVNYATGDWSGPTDQAEAVRWYRRAAEQGHAESQYDLGFMLLLGEGAPQNTDEGLTWLERAGEGGEYSAFRLLVDCYENGYCGVPVDPSKAAFWRARMEEYDRLHPFRRYQIGGLLDERSLGSILDIEGVLGHSTSTADSRIWVFYDPTILTPAQLDERIKTAGLAADPIE